MIICNCNIHLELFDVSSLKGRRSVVNSLKERLKRFNVSLLDISSEYPKEADIAFVFLSPDSLAAAQYREKIESHLHRQFPELDINMEYEEF